MNMADELNVRMNSVLVSGRKDETLTYARYVKDEATGMDVSACLAAKADATDMNEALGKKADKVDVNNALAKKADKNWVQGELDKKVDTSVFDEALKAKADANEVAMALDKKADASDMERALDGKADTIAVNEALSKKADKTETSELSTALGKKANAEEVENTVKRLDEDIKAAHNIDAGQVVMSSLGQDVRDAIAAAAATPKRIVACVNGVWDDIEEVGTTGLIGDGYAVNAKDMSVYVWKNRSWTKTEAVNVSLFYLDKKSNVLYTCDMKNKKMVNIANSMKIGTTRGTAYDGASGQQLANRIVGKSDGLGMPDNIVRGVSVDVTEEDKVLLRTNDAEWDGAEWGYSEENGHEIPAATEETAGVMSASDKKTLTTTAAEVAELKKTPKMLINVCSTKDTALLVDGERVAIPAHKAVILKEPKSVSVIGDGSVPAPECFTRFDIIYNTVEPWKMNRLSLGGYISTSDKGSGPHGMLYIPRLDVSLIDTSNMTNMSDMFFYCNNVEILDVGSFDTSRVTFFCGNSGGWSGPFRFCVSVKRLDVSGWDVRNCTSLAHFFSQCQSLVSVGDISQWDVSNVTDFGYMFYMCSSLVSVGDISQWDASMAQNMTSMFQGCSSLTSLNLSSWKKVAVNAKGLFYGCTNLVDIDLSECDVANVISFDEIFRNDGKLSTIISKKWRFDKLISCHGAFFNCSSLVTLPAIEINSDMCQLSELFFGCSSLSNIKLSVNGKRISSILSIFRDCKSLVAIEGIDGWDTSNISTMQDVFCGCSSLKTLDLSGWNLEMTASVFNIFYNCTSLASLTLGEGFGKMKDECGTLDLSSLSAWKNDSVKSLLTLYDRKANGMGVITIKLHANTKAVLGEDGIAALTAKGYTIA